MNSTHSTSTKMTCATNFDLPSLHILLEEIEAALKDAEVHLSEFHDDEEQAPLLMDSATVIEQLASVFNLINFKGSSTLASMIAKTLKKLHDLGDNTNSALIMDVSEAIMLLDRYIEFVLLKEILEPALLSPIINKLADHLGEPHVTIEELSKGSSICIINPASHYKNPSELGLDTKSLLSDYRTGLVIALTKKDNNLSADEVSKLDAMNAACKTIADQSDNLFWQAGYVATLHLAQKLPLSNDKKRTLIYLEQQFLNYLPLEDRRFANLVALASTTGNFAQVAAKRYGLGQSSETLQAQMKAFLFGPNREITDTLNTLIQDEISTIKEKVDSFVRGDNAINAISNTDIADQIQSLASTMQLLGISQAAHALSHASSQVRSWQNPTPADFDQLLGELMVAENASIFLTKSHTPGAVRLPLHNQSISLHQLDTAYGLLISESRTNIATVTVAIDSYLADPNKDALHLQNIPEMLEQVAGALKFLGLIKTASMTLRLGRYMTQAIQNATPLSESLLADIADVVVTADYELEGQERNRPVGKQAILIGQHSLSRILAA